MTGPSLSSVIDDYLLQSTNKKNFAGEQIYAKFWKARLGTCAPSSVTPDQINKSRTHLLTIGAGRRPLAHATVNRYVSWLHHIFEIEVELGKLERNPCMMRLQFGKLTKTLPVSIHPILSHLIPTTSQ